MLLSVLSLGWLRIVKKKPLDKHKKPCRYCGASLTVTRVRRWGTVCVDCQILVDQEQAQAHRAVVQRVVQDMQALIDREGYPPRSWRRWALPLSKAKRLKLYPPKSNFEFLRAIFSREQTQTIGEAGLWDQLMTQAKPGDKIAFFRSPKLTWECYCGREGFVVLRKGVPVYSVTTIAN